MVRFVFVPLTSLTIILITASTNQVNSRGIAPVRISPWTRAIHRKLCEEGGHPDHVAQKYFYCFEEDITPGGGNFVECQEEVYKVVLNTKNTVDQVCSSPRAKFREYISCATRKFLTTDNSTSNAMDKLNECHTTALSHGVPEPQTNFQRKY